MRTPLFLASRPVRTGLLALLAVYLFVARVGHSSHSFLMLADQIRDWRIALGPFRELPLVGTQSTAGGSSLGPVYYWVLWVSRVGIGPFVHNQPHAGAYGIAVLQGVADLALFAALRRRSGTGLALVAVLVTATPAHDLAVNSTIWNPSVSVALVKLALALRLGHSSPPSAPWVCASMATAWLAVQAHSSAIFVAVPLGVLLVLEQWRTSGLAAALRRTRLLVEVVAVLQLPYVAHLVLHAGEAVPTRAVAGATDAIAGGHLRFADSFHALSSGLLSILVAPHESTALAWLIVLLLVLAAWRLRADAAALSLTFAPIVLAGCGFALWQGEFNEYWYLPLAPCAAVAVAYGVTMWRPAISVPVVLVALAAVQPARLAQAQFSYRMPVYGPLSVGSVRAARQATSVRRIFTEFPMPMFSDETFPYEAAGGHIRGDAPFDVTIDAVGGIRFSPAAGTNP